MKSRRVSWASGVNLCQVVPFFKEDSPSQVGLAIRNNFPSVESISAFSNSATLKKLSYFGGKKLTNQLHQIVNISIPRWTCPSNYAVSCDWHLTAGEESQETMTQKLRELNVLEAIYPRVSAIPSSPAVSTDVERECYDDSLTPEIPLTPIEEMENKPDLEPTSPCTLNTETPEVPKQPVPSPTGPDFDFLAAASAACAVLLKSRKKESMIDPDLLVEIFNDPKLIGQLLKGGGSPAVGKVVVSESIPQTLQVPYSSPVVCPPNLAPNVQSNRPFSSPSPQSVLVPSPGQTVNPSFHFANRVTQPVDHFSRVSPPPTSHGHPLGPSPGLDMVTQPFENHPMIPPPIQPVISSFDVPPAHPQAVSEKVTRLTIPSDTYQLALNIKGKVNYQPSVPKDTNYLKSLIREHGGQGNLRPNLIASQNMVNLKMGNPLIQEQMNFNDNRKLCIFFNSPEGCYSGNNCPFQHDIGTNWDDGRNSKRAKLGLVL